MISDATSFCKSPDSTKWIQQMYILSLLRAPASSEQGEPYCFKRVVQKQRIKEEILESQRANRKNKQLYSFNTEVELSNYWLLECLEQQYLGAL